MKSDDRLAFTELYKRYWKKLYAIAYNRLESNFLAEDVVHDVLVTLWINRTKLNIEVLENYLATAAKYAVFTKLKKAQREKSFVARIESEEFVVTDVQDRLHCKKILEQIRIQVETLPERCKLIFKYSREEGMAVKEIARELNISPKTVENQLTKALKHLRLAVNGLLHTFLIISIFF